MPEEKRFGRLVAGTLAVVALLGAAAPAAAASAHQRSCLRYSYSIDRWVNVCRTYAYHNAGPRLDAAPHPFYYPYRYEPPYTSNGPYYGYEPYNGYQSALGIWF
jgi:hypothetical protein